jgi:asparagine synthase (glutamine-hydrolysing)
MVADVPLGAFLSGGIDSSIIVALMARHSDRAIKTFSIGFKDDPLYDETRYARDVAEMYRTDHREINLSFQDMLDVFPEVLDTFDEPFADSSAIPTYMVSRETRNHVTVALSGDGGDELFAGYRSYLAEYWFRKYQMIPALLRRNILERMIFAVPDNREAWLGEYARRAKKFIRGTQGHFHQRVLALKEIFPQSIRRELLQSNNRGPADPALDWAAGFLNRFKGDHINRILYLDLKDSLPGDMLNKVDWMSMKNSLEVRVPFLDHRVVELAFEIPGPLKLRRGITKHFLKSTFKSLLPKSLHRRSKAGFEIPISRWLRDDLKQLVYSYLGEERIRDQGIFDYPIVKGLVDSHLQKKTDTSWMLWNLIVFQYWHEKYGH